MNCLELEKYLDEWLDKRGVPLEDLEPGLEAHVLSCPRCLATSARHQLLRRAISVLRPPPRPSAASMGRLYALSVPSSLPAKPGRASMANLRRVRYAAAAAVFALAWLGSSWWTSTELTDRFSPESRIPLHPHRPLGLALAEATEATFDLAREASAPASRIGREMFDLGQSTNSSPAFAPGLGRDLRPSDETASSPSDLFRAVGERVGAGVKPISGSARHAFSFLFGPPAESGPVPPERRDNL